MSTKPKCADCTDPRCAECVTRAGGRISRRQFVKQAVCSGLALSGVGALLSACASVAPEEAAQAPTQAPAQVPNEAAPPSATLPAEGGRWTPPAAHVGDWPAGTATVEIRDVGTFSFDAGQVKTLRPDIFQPGHFSLFDALAHLGERGDIGLETHFDEALDTHVIDAINGRRGWWYEAHYSRGWYELNAFRMDMYPYKNGTQMRLYPEREGRLANIYRAFQEEVARLADNGGRIIVPELVIQAPGVDHTFQDVVVTPHDVRSDVLQPGVVTALDALLSLAEEGRLSSLMLTWYERIGGADPVDSYWVEQMDQARASGGCGFVYETGPRSFSGFSGSHIHIPSDVRVTVSPEYALWFWICL
jgi:hypothetical protein